MSENKTLVLDFIEQHKRQYFYWIKSNMKQFPWCCHSSSVVLADYLRTISPNVKVIAGDILNTNKYATTHLWVEVNDIVIDFTRFQFQSFFNLRRRFKREYALAHFSDTEAYTLFIDGMQQGQVIFARDEYYKNFAPREAITVNNRPTAIDADFSTYLAQQVKDGCADVCMKE